MSEHHSRHEIVEHINSLIAVHGIKKSELTFPRKSIEKGVVRFRDPATGKTWTGHGRAPAWFKNVPGAKEVFKI